MAGSYLASEIDRDYRRKKYYQNKKKRQTCLVDKDKQCDKCKYNGVCLDNIE